MSNPTEYLSPIGGIPLPSYRIPAIIIVAIGYGPLVLIASYKAQHRDTRTTTNLGATIFAIERIILLSLHAVASINPDWRGSLALAKYTEISLSLAYIVIANDAVSLLRRAQGKQSSGGCLADVKEARKGLAVAGALGIIAGGFFRFNLEWPGPAGRLVLALRCASAGVALLFTVIIALAAGWSYRNQPHVPRRPLEIVLSLAFLTSAVAIYRLAVSNSANEAIRFSSLELSITRKTPTGVSNSAAAGPLFLVFHLLPEWMSIALLIGTNLREETESGDYRQAPSADIPV